MTVIGLLWSSGAVLDDDSTVPVPDDGTGWRYREKGISIYTHQLTIKGVSARIQSSSSQHTSEEEEEEEEEAAMSKEDYVKHPKKQR